MKLLKNIIWEDAEASSRVVVEHTDNVHNNVYNHVWDIVNDNVYNHVWNGLIELIENDLYDII